MTSLITSSEAPCADKDSRTAAKRASLELTGFREEPPFLVEPDFVFRLEGELDLLWLDAVDRETKAGTPTWEL